MSKLNRIAVILVLWVAVATAHAACGPMLSHSMKQLHTSKTVDLCDQFAGQPLLIVNTASHCGFTPQFTALEQMHQQYKDKGIGFIGVSSNSFNQAAASEEKAAEVCFVNFGVTFAMMAPVPVRGSDAHPLFKELASQSAPPRWNFYKYVVSPEGKVMGRFGSTVKPDDKRITDLLDQMIVQQ